MYPWFREMYAVVQIGSTIFKSECMTTLRVVCAAVGLARLARTTAAIRKKSESFLIDHSYV
jgi:hypothetical protein